jgi:hypothetical protein
MQSENDRRSEPRRPGSGDRNYQYAVCGFGPAGSGFLLHAWKTGLLERMAEGGVAVIDRAGTLGAGSIGQYLLTGNSLASAFTDCIDDPGYQPLFDDLRVRDPAVRKMREISGQAPPLDLTAVFLETMVERFVEHLTRQLGVKVLRETDILRVIQLERDGYRIDVRERATGLESSVFTQQIISAFGGRQNADVVAEDPIAPEFTLGPWREKLVMSDAFLRWSDEQIREAIPLEQGGEVFVVGGSHSTMSTVDRLSQALAPRGMRRVTILYRTPFRLYYASPDEALADGYGFDDPNDLCPISGRVNRFGGLRYRSFEVAKSIMKTGRMPELAVEARTVRLTHRNFEKHGIVEGLDRAPAIVTCLGYQANTPCLASSRGGMLELDNTPTGLRVDGRGQALLTNGSALPGFYAIGLGSKLLQCSQVIGGEPSFRAQADGVWLYQNHGAIPVARSIAEPVLEGRMPQSGLNELRMRLHLGDRPPI